ncbi:MAG: NAD(P)-dependent oxidoreductase [Bacteroidota bacterium]|jgi:putative NADH-flavin reductase
MNVVIFGATGYSGKAILQEAIHCNFKVTVLVRDPLRLTLTHPNLKVITGDVMDRHSVALSLDGQDAVIQCLGIGGKGSAKATTFISEATGLIIDEMEKKGIKRLVAMSNVGAGNSIAFLPRFFVQWILPYFMKWLQVIIDDKNRMEVRIMSSKLMWTIVRCPNITDKPAKGVFRATLDGEGLRLSVTRKDMAAFMIKQLNDDTYHRQAPSISN